MFRILENRRLAPNVHELVIEAPRIADEALAGQFVILMPDQKSERVPFTLSDWDCHNGTITLIVLEMGRASRELLTKRPGDQVAHLVGPLGQPLEIDNYGTVALAAGCYGIGAIVCIARALRQAGNHVIAVVEARSHYLHYYMDKLEAVADEVIQTTIDGSAGEKGHSVDVIARKLADGQKLDRVIAVGCPFMMMLTARETEPHGVKTLAALNTIMVDGTGMCGACRVSIAGETKFACVDGPFFDAHQVDWEQVFGRREAYSPQEIDALQYAEGEHAHQDDEPCRLDQEITKPDTEQHE
jgi:NAD(P)H-flavin reductase